MASFESESVAWVDPYIIELSGKAAARRGASAEGGGGHHGHGHHSNHHHHSGGGGVYAFDDDAAGGADGMMGGDMGGGGGVLDLEDDSQRVLFDKWAKMLRHREASSVGSVGVLGAMRASAGLNRGTATGAGAGPSQHQQQQQPAPQPTGPTTELPAPRTESVLNGPPEDPYTHVACANDTFVAVSGRSGIIHFFDKEDIIPRHSLKLYGVAGVKDSGAPPAAGFTAAVTAGSGGISGVQGTGFFSNLAALGTLGGGAGSGGGAGGGAGGPDGSGGPSEATRPIDSRDPVVNVLLDPMGRHAVVLFASGASVVYHIRKALSGHGLGDDDDDDDDGKKGKKKKQKKSSSKKAKALLSSLVGGSNSATDHEMKPVRCGFAINSEATGISGFSLASIGWSATNTSEATTDTVIFGSRSGGVLCTGRLGVMGVTDARPLFTLPPTYARAGPISSIAQYVDDPSCYASTSSGARSAVVLVAQANRLFFFSGGPCAGGGLRSRGLPATADTPTVLSYIFSPFVGASSLPNCLVLPAAPPPAKHHTFFATVAGDRSGGGGGGGAASNTISGSFSPHAAGAGGAAGGAKGRAAQQQQQQLQQQQEAAARASVATATNSSVSLVLPYAILSQRRQRELEDSAGRGGGDDNASFDAALNELKAMGIGGGSGSGGGRDRGDGHGGGAENNNGGGDAAHSFACSLGNSILRYGGRGRGVRGYAMGGGAPSAAGASASSLLSASSEVSAETVGADSPLNDPPMCFAWSYDHWHVTGVVNVGIATVTPEMMACGLSNAAGDVHARGGGGGGGAKGGGNTSDPLARDGFCIVEEGGLANLIVGLDFSTAAHGTASSSSPSSSALSRSGGGAAASPFYDVPSTVLTVVNAIDMAAVIGGYEALQWQSRQQSALVDSQGGLSSGLRGRMGVGGGGADGSVGASDYASALGGGGGPASALLTMTTVPSAFSPSSFYALDPITNIVSTYFHTTVTTTKKQYTFALPPFLAWEAANALPSLLDRAAPALLAGGRNAMHTISFPFLAALAEAAGGGANANNTINGGAADPHAALRRDAKGLAGCVTSMLLSVSAASPDGQGGGAFGGDRGLTATGGRHASRSLVGANGSSGSNSQVNAALLVNSYRPFALWPPPPAALAAMASWSGSLRALTDAANSIGGGGATAAAAARSSLFGGRGGGGGGGSLFSAFGGVGAMGGPPAPLTPLEQLRSPTAESYLVVANAAARQAAHEARNRILLEVPTLSQAQRSAIAQMELGPAFGGAAAAASLSSRGNHSTKGGAASAGGGDAAFWANSYASLHPAQQSIGSLLLISQTPAAALAPGLATSAGSAPAGPFMLQQQSPRGTSLFNGCAALEGSDMLRFYVLRFGGRALTEVSLLPHRLHFANMLASAAKRCTAAEARLIQQRADRPPLLVAVREAAEQQAAIAAARANHRQPMSASLLSASGGGGGAQSNNNANNNIVGGAANPRLVSALAPYLAPISPTAATVANGGAAPHVSGSLLFSMALMLASTPLRLYRQDPFRHSQYATVRSHMFAVAATQSPSAAVSAGGATVASSSPAMAGQSIARADGGGPSVSTALLGSVGVNASRHHILAAARDAGTGGTTAATSTAAAAQQLQLNGLAAHEEEDLLASLPAIRHAYGALAMNQPFLNIRFDYAKYLAATHRPLQAARHFAQSTAADAQTHLPAAVRATKRGKEQRTPYAGLASSPNSFNSALVALASASTNCASLAPPAMGAGAAAVGVGCNGDYGVGGGGLAAVSTGIPNDPSAALLVAVSEKARILGRTRTEQNKAMAATNVFGNEDEDEDGGEDDGGGCDEEGATATKRQKDPPPAATPALHALSTWALELLLHRSACEAQEERLQFRQLAYRPDVVAALFATGEGNSRRGSLDGIGGAAALPTCAKKLTEMEERTAKLRNFRHAYSSSSSAANSSTASSSSPSHADPFELRLLSYYGVRGAAPALQALLRRSRRALSWAASQQDIFAMGVDAAIVHFCAHMRHYPELLQHQIASGRHFEAVVFLINLCADSPRYYNSCWVRCSYELIRKFPVRLIQEGWIRRGATMGLDPLKLIPAVMAYNPSTNDLRRYAEGPAQPLIEELERSRLMAVVRQQVDTQRAIDSERTVPIFRRYGLLHKPALARRSRRAAAREAHLRGAGIAGGVGGFASPLMARAGIARRTSMAFVSPSAAIAAAPFGGGGAAGSSGGPSAATASASALFSTPLPLPAANGRARSLSMLLTKGPSASPMGGAIGGGAGRHASHFEGGAGGGTYNALHSPAAYSQVQEHQGIAFLRHVLGVRGGGGGSGGGGGGSLQAMGGSSSSSSSEELMRRQCLYNLLLHLLATTHSVPDSEVAAFLEGLPPNAIDSTYAYRVCMANGRPAAALQILFALGFVDDAIDQSLLLRDVASAVTFIKKMRRGGGGESGRTRRRELWRRVVAFVAEEDKVGGAQSALNLIAESNGDINVSHVLPLLSDDVIVSTFTNELDRNVRVFGSELQSLQSLITQSERETEALKAEHRAEASRRVVFDQTARCAACGQQVLTDHHPVFFRRCRHVFHASCLRKGTMSVAVGRQLLGLGGVAGDESSITYAAGHMRPPQEADFIAIGNHSSTNSHAGLRLGSAGGFGSAASTGLTSAALAAAAGTGGGGLADPPSSSAASLQYPIPVRSTDCPTAADQPDFIPESDTAATDAAAAAVERRLASSSAFRDTVEGARLISEGYRPPQGLASTAAAASSAEAFGGRDCAAAGARCFLCDPSAANAFLGAPLELPMVSIDRGFKLAAIQHDLAL